MYTAELAAGSQVLPLVLFSGLLDNSSSRDHHAAIRFTAQVKIVMAIR